VSDCRAELEALLGRDRVGSIADLQRDRVGSIDDRRLEHVQSIARPSIGAHDASASIVPHDEIPLARPADEAELVELLHFASRTSKKLLPVGFGSKIAWSGPLEPIDFALSTRAITGVVAYEPEDGTLTARAGSTIAELADIARRGGNHLTPDVAHTSHATLGGTLAAGHSGIDRTRYGPARHHVLGMRVVLADGTIARSGGRLVKNVTGFDMHRLYCGSHGTLGVIVECSLRLFAGPEATAFASASFATAADAVRAARSIEDEGARPYALVLEHALSKPLDWRLHVALAGRREPVEWELDLVRHEFADPVIDRDERARAAIDALRDRVPPIDARMSLRVNALPSELQRALELVERNAHSSELDLDLFVQPSIACVDIAIASGAFPSAAAAAAATSRDAARHATSDNSPAATSAHFAATAAASRTVPSPSEPLTVLVRELRAAKLDVRIRNAPIELARSLDIVGDIGPGIDWMRRLKHALDPSGVFPSRGFQVGA
jgi:FAD/FMN-containing dehydrogenase